MLEMGMARKTANIPQRLEFGEWGTGARNRHRDFSEDALWHQAGSAKAHGHRSGSRKARLELGSPKAASSQKRGDWPAEVYGDGLGAAAWTGSLEPQLSEGPQRQRQEQRVRPAQVAAAAVGRPRVSANPSFAVTAGQGSVLASAPPPSL